MPGYIWLVFKSATRFLCYFATNRFPPRKRKPLQFRGMPAFLNPDSSRLGTETQRNRTAPKLEQVSLSTRPSTAPGRRPPLGTNKAGLVSAPPVPPLSSAAVTGAATAQSCPTEAALLAGARPPGSAPGWGRRRRRRQLCPDKFANFPGGGDFLLAVPAEAPHHTHAHTTPPLRPASPSPPSLRSLAHARDAPAGVPVPKGKSRAARSGPCRGTSPHTHLPSRAGPLR